MRKWLDIVVVTCLLGLLIPQEVGITITHCAHSGHISMFESPGEMDCGMGSDEGCMQHFTFKVSDFSAINAYIQFNQPQLAAVLPMPVLVLDLLTEGHPSLPAIQASPPGFAFHMLLPLRN